MQVNCVCGCVLELKRARAGNGVCQLSVAISRDYNYIMCSYTMSLTNNMWQSRVENEHYFVCMKIEFI